MSKASHIVKRLIEGVDDIDPKEMLLGFYTKPIYLYRGFKDKNVQWTGCYYEGEFVGKYRFNPDDPYVVQMGGWEVVPEAKTGGWITYVTKSEADAVKKIKKVMGIKDKPRRLPEGVDDFDPKEMALSLRYQLYPIEPFLGDLELYNVSTADGSSHLGRIAFEDHSKRPAYASKGEWDVMEKWARYRKSPWAAYSRYQTGIVYFATREAALEYILRAANVNEGADDPDDVIGRNAKSLRLQTTDFKAVHHGTVQWPEFDEASPESDPPYIRYYGYLKFPGVKDLNWNVDLEWDAEIGIRAVGYYGFYDRDDEWRELHDLPTNEAQAKAKALLDKDVTRFLSKLGKFVLISKTFVP